MPPSPPFPCIITSARCNGELGGNLEQRDAAARATRRPPFPLPPPSPSRCSFLPSSSLVRRLSVFSLRLSNLGCYRGNTGTGRQREETTEGHRRREETAENGKDSFACSLSSSHFALRTLLPSSAFSCQSPPHLPPFGLIRCSKKSIRLSLPTRSSVFSFYGACVRSTLFLSLRFSLSLSLCLFYSTLSFSLVATVRHFVCVTCREKPLTMRRNGAGQRGRMTQEG